MKLTILTFLAIGLVAAPPPNSILPHGQFPSVVTNQFGQVSLSKVSYWTITNEICELYVSVDQAKWFLGATVTNYSGFVINADFSTFKAAGRPLYFRILPK